MSARWRLFAALVCAAALIGCASPTAVTGKASTAPTRTPSPPADSLPGALTYVAERTALPGETVTPSPTAAPPTATVAPPRPSGGGQPQPPAPAAVPSATPAPTDNPVAPLIETFTASPDRVNPGDTISLAWKTNVSQVSLRPVLSNGQYGTWLDEPGEGTTTYTVPATERNPFSIMLVIGSQENPVYKEIKFSIICPDKWFVDNPPGTCPQPAVSGSGAAQRFQHGMMVWVGGIDLIVVLRDGKYWNQRTNTWQQGMPESDDTLTPPDGLSQPVRGFGKVWREDSGVRDDLGWALAPEFPTPVTYQCDTLYKRTICLLAGPDGVLKLGLWGDWGPYTGP